MKASEALIKLKEEDLLGYWLWVAKIILVFVLAIPTPIILGLMGCFK